MQSTFTDDLSPRRMMEPFPKSFSILSRAILRALSLPSLIAASSFVSLTSFSAFSALVLVSAAIYNSPHKLV